jgi:hypothetical protein
MQNKLEYDKPHREFIKKRTSRFVQKNSDAAQKEKPGEKSSRNPARKKEYTLSLCALRATST